MKKSKGTIRIEVRTNIFRNLKEVFKPQPKGQLLVEIYAIPSPEEMISNIRRFKK